MPAQLTQSMFEMILTVAYLSRLDKIEVPLTVINKKRLLLGAAVFFYKLLTP